MRAIKHHKKSQSLDWHPADIIAALRKAGWSLRSLSVHHGLNAGTLKNVLQRPYPKGERHIAEALTMSPWEIWPSRYAVSTDDTGSSIGIPNRGSRGRKAGKLYDTGCKKTCNVKKHKAA